MTRPDFLIIGAARAGTTWLAHQLGRHPRLWIAEREIHYFSLRPEQPEGWYRGHFPASADQQIVGERSCSYLAWPGTAERVARALPEVRVIACLRDPVERAYSGYCMQLARGVVSPRIEQHLDPARVVGTAAEGFLSQGLYARHLEPFLDRLGAERVLCVFFDDLERPRELVARALAFLGLEPGSPRPSVERRNARSELVLAPWLARLSGLLGRPPSATTVRASRLRALARYPLWPALVAPLAYPPLSDGLRRRIGAYYAEDLARLPDLLGREIPPWCRA